MILDWDLWEFDPSSLAGLYEGVAARLRELRLECGLDRGQPELVVDPVATGLMVIDEGSDRRDLDVRALDSEEPLKRSSVERATECGIQLGKRRVKIARTAYEKATTFKGVQRNHLLAQMRAFKLDTAEQASVAPLLAAASGAVCDALRLDRELDMWRRLGKSSAPEEAQRLIDAAGQMIVERPQRAVPLEQHLRECLLADQSGRETAAARRRVENERLLEVANLRDRAALAERDRRMQAEAP